MPSIHLVTGSVKYLPVFAGKSFAFASEALDMRDYEKTGKDRKSLPLWGRWAGGSEVGSGKASPTASGPPLSKGEGIGKSNFNFINKTTP